MIEEMLVEKVKGGNQEALAQLLFNNYEVLFKYLIKFTFNKALAEDLTQETMIKAIEKIDYYNEKKAKFSTWLISIGQNIYLDHLRKQKRENKYILQQNDNENSLLNLISCTKDDSFYNVLEALERMDEGVRLPILLKHYYGYSYEEIAKKMSLPTGTIKSRIHNGLNTIRKELGYDG